MHQSITNLKNTLSPISHQLKSNNNNKKKRNNYRSSILAIAIVFIFSLSTIAQAKNDKKEKVIKPGKRQAVLILPDGKTIELSANDSLNYSPKVQVSPKSNTSKDNSAKNTSPQNSHNPKQSAETNEEKKELEAKKQSKG